MRFCLSFVQSIEYHRDQGGEYPRYPSETVMDGWCDCEDSAILFAALANHLEYDCVFLEFGSDGFLGVGKWGHVDVGIAASYDGEFSGTYWTKHGRKYYYVACSARGWDIGDDPGDKYNSAKIYSLEA